MALSIFLTSFIQQSLLVKYVKQQCVGEPANKYPGHRSESIRLSPGPTGIVPFAVRAETLDLNSSLGAGEKNQGSREGKYTSAVLTFSNCPDAKTQCKVTIHHFADRPL